MRAVVAGLNEVMAQSAVHGLRFRERTAILPYPVRDAGVAGKQEIFGKKYVEADLLFRYLDIPAKSASVINNQEERILRCLEAYTEGVNYYYLLRCERFRAGYKQSVLFQLLKMILRC